MMYPKFDHGGTMRKLLVVLGTLLASITVQAPAANAYTYYGFDMGCYGATIDCFATNTSPTAGKSGDFGNASANDNVTSLPTTDNGGTWGSPTIIYESWPSQNGGDYGVYWSQSYGSTTMTIDTTNNYWKFAMGGGGQCKGIDGSTMTCDGVKDDAPLAANGASVAYGSLHAYFPLNSLYFGHSCCTVTLGSWQNVMSYDSISGSQWQGFLCYMFHDYTDSELGLWKHDIEYCRSTWSDTGTASGSRAVCGDIGGIVWVGPGSAYGNLGGNQVTNGAKGWTAYSLSVTRAQFTAAITDLNKINGGTGCNGTWPTDPNYYMDLGSQSGYEDWGTGNDYNNNLTFETGGDSLFTTY